ncbi:MarR family winged helix-turn-helix transcriptional regulator [Catellatospora citrea]|uniref:MarR family transcriptional regulator n=1 Tax=Catellatospora citrea TaxID=53366 RepID=A0A8J3P1J8_9ACTN|nr:MarR family transcriptional regulator [Catellatospora citrea]GIG00167.1 MarR family transcriptional regulator [Catellatospora citrea]
MSEVTAPAPEAPSMLLEDQLCFTLYAASRTVTSAYRPILEPVGLTYPQYLVMLVLWDRGPVAVKDLISALQLEYGTITPLIKRLEANGLITRHRRGDDERVVEVALTAQGEALRERVQCVPTAIGEAMGLTAEEIDAVQVILRRLTANAARHA